MRIQGKNDKILVFWKCRPLFLGGKYPIRISWFNGEFCEEKVELQYNSLFFYRKWICSLLIPSFQGQQIPFHFRSERKDSGLKSRLMVDAFHMELKMNESKRLMLNVEFGGFALRTLSDDPKDLYRAARSTYIHQCTPPSCKSDHVSLFTEVLNGFSGPPHVPLLNLILRVQVTPQEVLPLSSFLTRLQVSSKQPFLTTRYNGLLEFNDNSWFCVPAVYRLDREESGSVLLCVHLNPCAPHLGEHTDICISRDGKIVKNL